MVLLSATRTWRNGRRKGLKIPRELLPVPVRVRPSAPAKSGTWTRIADHRPAWSTAASQHHLSSLATATAPCHMDEMTVIRSLETTSAPARRTLAFAHPGEAFPCSSSLAVISPVRLREVSICPPSAVTTRPPSGERHPPAIPSQRQQDVPLVGGHSSPSSGVRQTPAASEPAST